MAVNHILMQGSGCGSWELKPRHNLPAQLPLSNYSECCSGHSSERTKLKTKRRLPGRAAVKRPQRFVGQTRDALNAQAPVLSGFAHKRKMYHERKTKGNKAAEALRSVKSEKLKMF